MHTVLHAGSKPAQPRGGDSGGKKARVAVAGATGYTGQELLRLLGRHPAVTVTAAMSSGAAGTAPRRLPALARIWDGDIVPFLAEGLAPLADLVFLALPDKAAAESGPSLVEAAVAGIALSGRFRRRGAAPRAPWCPET